MAERSATTQTWENALGMPKEKNQSIVLRLTSASVLIRTRGWARPSSSRWGSWPTATPRHWSVRGRSSSPTTFPATASGAAETKKKHFNRRCHLLFYKKFQRHLLPTKKKGVFLESTFSASENQKKKWLQEKGRLIGGIHLPSAFPPPCPHWQKEMN